MTMGTICHRGSTISRKEKSIGGHQDRHGHVLLNPRKMLSGFRYFLPFYSSLLDSCSTTHDLRRLRLTHAQVLTTGLAPHDFIRTKLSSTYALCLQIPEALYIFSRANRRTTFLYNSLLRPLVHLRLFPAALHLFRHMLTHRTPRDHRTFATLLCSCANLPSLRLGQAGHAMTISEGFSAHDAVSNSLISMYSKCGDIISARQVFDEMAERRNIVSWTAMLDGCGNHGSTREVVAMVEGMLGQVMDAAAMTAVLSACARGGLIELGMKVFDDMREGRLGVVRPTVEHYTCMVDMLGRAGLVEEAERVIGEMKVEPDEALLRALLLLDAGKGKCIHRKLN